MDNQQALTEREIGWLCGFFDGEGNIGMNITKNYSALKDMNTRRHTIMVPRLSVANTDYATIMFWQRLCDKVPVGNHISTQRMNHPKHKPVYRGTINGHKRCLKIIPVLLLGCITKKAQLSVVDRWLQHRQENYQYSLIDYEFMKEYTAVSGNGPNDLTLRRLYESCTAEHYLKEGIRYAR